jgi:MerR family mercuric resistance operon transcriptional regulator
VGSFTIGKLAAAAGVNVETVRYYERRGLIEQPDRAGAGYRQYSADDLWRLRFVARGKELGFTLAEIAELMAGDGGRTAEGILAAARAKIADVEQRQRRLYETRCRLEQLAQLCESGDTAGCVTLQLG